MMIIIFIYTYSITVTNNARRSELRNERRITPDVLSPAGMIRSEAVQRDTVRTYASLGRAHDAQKCRHGADTRWSWRTVSLLRENNIVQQANLIFHVRSRRRFIATARKWHEAVAMDVEYTRRRRRANI